MLYILIAIALLGALSYSFTKDTNVNVSAQMAGKAGQELYVQANLIRGVILECTLSHPEGGGDLDGDGQICADTAGACAAADIDNPNTPFPLNPYNGALAYPNSLLPATTFSANSDNIVRNIACIDGTVSPATKQLMFQGAGSQGRFLPPPPPGFGEWAYTNDADGVRITITGAASAQNLAALTALKAKFPACQADLDYGSCGSTCFTAWIQRNACP